MTKRYYKVGETIWLKELGTKGEVLSLDLENKEVNVKSGGEQHRLKLWEIDKLKTPLPKLYFAKVREDAVIPSKSIEDAGYDIYANLKDEHTRKSLKPLEDKPDYSFPYEIKEMRIAKGEVGFVPTGIASAMDNDYFLNINAERSSVGKYGIVVLAGVVDSSYRGEIMVMVQPTQKDLIITNEVSEVEVGENEILYPLTKAIAQGVLLPVPKVKVEEIPYDELKAISSNRGTGGWGSSGK